MSKKRSVLPSDPRRMQLCPLCGAAHPVSQRRCTICGAALSGEPTSALPVSPVSGGAGSSAAPLRYDPARGDDDLYIGDLRGRMWRVVIGLGIAAAIGVCAMGGWWLWRGQQASDEPSAAQSELLTTGTPGTGTPDAASTGTPATVAPPTAPPTATSRNLWPTASPTVTSMALLPYATVTPVPPTATITPTPGPCYQTAGAGDTVYGMATRCGHLDMAIVDVILELNGMKSAVELQINQTLEIPWPTPTPGGEAPQSSDPNTTPDTNSAETVLNEFGTPDVLEALVSFEPTLRPGLAWHSVQTGETVMSIAWDYNTNLKTLSELNPEVPFLQCDFGSESGGENCSVMLYEGQEVRVPVPLPTTTPSPTPAGTLTPTPTATATFNAPFPINPVEGAHFFADQQVTLRWGGTGTLSPDERYLVRVYDQATGAAYMAPVDTTSYVLPGGWQPADGRKHSMEWTISVARLGAQFEVLNEQYITEPSHFTWDSR